MSDIPGDGVGFRAAMNAMAEFMPTFSGRSGSTVVTDFASADAYFLEINDRAAMDGDMFVYPTGYVTQVWFRYAHPSAPGVSVWSYVNFAGSFLSV